DSGEDEAPGFEVTNNSAITVTNQELDAKVEYSLDGGLSWLDDDGYAQATSADGSYTVWVRQTDKAGNESEVSDALTFEKDATGPAAASNGGIAGQEGSYTKGDRKSVG